MSGGNCPETPRQKMIGMMYLFLTAMLALNVSGELLQAFQLVDKSIQQSIKAVDTKNDQLYATFDAAEMTNPKKVKGNNDRAKEIRVKADSLYNHIEALKVRMMRMVDDSPEATTTSFLGADNQDIAPQVMMVERGGAEQKELKRLINEYKILLLTHVDPNDTVLRATLESSLSTEAEEPSQKGQVAVSWESQKFEHLPLSASFALMSSMQSNVRTGQADVVSYLLSKVDEGSYKFNKVEEIVIPRSSYVIKGGEYYAQILLAATDTLQFPEYNVIGHNIDILNNGRGELRIPANSLGKKTWKGQIVFKDPNGARQTRDISHEYEVIQPNVVISPVKMNVFYEALENPVEISVPGVTGSQLKISMTNATFRKKGDEYIVKPKAGMAGAKSIVTVSAEINGRTRRLGSQEFRIKKVPDPIAMVAGKREGKIRKGTLLAQGGVFAEMGDDFDFDLKFKVTQFNVATIKNGFYVDKPSKSNKITEEQLDLIRGVGRGSRVVFEDIRAVGPDGRTRKLGSITFMID
ncbi:gliding motility protein GldM [Carboxylicivirga sp. N1Y90]|uniref:type IX secretion system motor protein PorM/GldM n=1 Tax=Carboxylicivirga fragile TaxID=3417571 RepID=UPI003D34E03B|nr:gliding motility protein GldM [Marinilabiliaceae bacterium N1Y90]